MAEVPPLHTPQHDHAPGNSFVGDVAGTYADRLKAITNPEPKPQPDYGSEQSRADQGPKPVPPMPKGI